MDEKPPPTTLQRTSNDSSASAGSRTCPRCGEDVHDDGAGDVTAQRRICELESQVAMLTNKASSAVDKLADYEDELRQLKQGRSSKSSPKRQSFTPNPLNTVHRNRLTDVSHLDNSPRPPNSNPTSDPQQQEQQQQRPGVQSRFSSFLLSRRTPSPSSTGMPANVPPPITTTSRESDLMRALQAERNLRQAAEETLTQVNGELEELSSQLFQSANDMVAQERKARAKLEERVKTLERRDKEKRKRLERLEEALGRVERVRGLLAAGAAAKRSVNATAAGGGLK